MIRPSYKSRLRAARLGIAALLVLPAASFAQDASSPAPDAAPASAHTFTANVGIFSQYVFRGIAQTAGRPSVQGGFDYAHAGGLYVGTWAANVSFLQDFGAYSRSSAEIDLYGGYKANLGASGIVLDLGTIYYAYPGTRHPEVVSADAWEIYAGAGYRWASVKYSLGLKDYFGARPAGEKTDGSWYLDFSVAAPAGDSGLSLQAHFGILDVANDGAGDARVSCNDWRLGASWTVPKGPLAGLELGAFYTGTSSNSAFYTDLTGYDTAKDTGVVYVKKTF